MSSHDITSLVIGFCLALICEAILAAKRRKVLSDRSPSSTGILLVMALGFLGRLSVLFIGAIVGKETGWYRFDLFLYSFVAGLLVGEVSFFVKIKRK